MKFRRKKLGSESTSRIGHGSTDSAVALVIPILMRSHGCWRVRQPDGARNRFRCRLVVATRDSVENSFQQKIIHLTAVAHRLVAAKRNLSSLDAPNPWHTDRYPLAAKPYRARVASGTATALQLVLARLSLSRQRLHFVVEQLVNVH